MGFQIIVIYSGHISSIEIQSKTDKKLSQMKTLFT